MEAHLECASKRCFGSDDRDIAHKQLGREPEGMLGVAARCSYGAPAVLLCSPVVERGRGTAEPFPTLYWLSCLYLREAAGRIEGGEDFSRIRRLAREDESFARRLMSAAEEYRARRLCLFGRLDSKIRSELGDKAADDLLQSGPGGVKDPVNIKCVHIHLATWLAGIDDPVGGIVAAIIKESRGM